MSQTPLENDPNSPGPKGDPPKFSVEEDKAVMPTPADDRAPGETQLPEDGLHIKRTSTPSGTELDICQELGLQKGSPLTRTESQVDTAAASTAHHGFKSSGDTRAFLAKDDETMLIPRWFFNVESTEPYRQREPAVGARIRPNWWPPEKPRTFYDIARPAYFDRVPPPPPPPPPIAKYKKVNAGNTRGYEEGTAYRGRGMALRYSNFEAERAYETDDETETETEDETRTEGSPKPHNPFDTSPYRPWVDDESVTDTETQDSEIRKDNLDSGVQDPKEGADGPVSSSKHLSKSSGLSKKAKEDKSPAEEEWARRKALGEKSEVLDKIMLMIGLEDFKMEFLTIKATIEAARQRRGQLRRKDLNLVLMGNPGTGKTNRACPTWARCITKPLTTVTSPPLRQARRQSRSSTVASSRNATSGLTLTRVWLATILGLALTHRAALPLQTLTGWPTTTPCPATTYRAAVALECLIGIFQG